MSKYGIHVNNRGMVWRLVLKWKCWLYFQSSQLIHTSSLQWQCNGVIAIKWRLASWLLLMNNKTVPSSANICQVYKRALKIWHEQLLWWASYLKDCVNNIFFKNNHYCNSTQLWLLQIHYIKLLNAEEHINHWAVINCHLQFTLRCNINDLGSSVGA